MYDKIMEDVLPSALSIGVDYGLFWELNPKSLEPFVKAFSLSQENIDRNNWLQGMYIKMAIVSSMDKKTNYPTKPFSEKASKKLSPREHMLEIRDKVLRTANVINSNFK